MVKVFNIIIVIFITIFFYKVFSFYNSFNNKDLISKNRENIGNLIDDKIKDIPLFENDTNDVIEFNSGYNQNDNKKKKKFWNLFKKWKKKQ